MQWKDDLSIAGRLTIKKLTLEGVLVDEVTVNNDITLAGRTLIAKLFSKDELEVDDKIERVSQIRLGTKKDPFEPGQTNLLGPVDGWKTDITTIERKEAPNSRIMLTMSGELDEKTCNGALQEAGLFTKDNVMYNRVTFDTITKSDQFKLALTWEITF